VLILPFASRRTPRSSSPCRAARSESVTRAGQTLPGSVTFAMGAVVGLVTVYTTMPLECVKFLPRAAFITDTNLRIFFLSESLSPVWSRRALARSRSGHPHNLNTAILSIARIVSLRRRGILRFWTGRTPRLARLVVRPIPFSYHTHHAK
jgi:solute carrier family 25 (mitochondrial citrate transporter), member 1